MRLLLFGLLGIPFFPLLTRADVSATVEETRALVATGEVLVENVNGPITIETWDKPEVRLVAVKSARSEADLATLDVRIDATESRFAVKSVYRKKDGSWFKTLTTTCEVRYTLIVPHTASLRRIETMNGSVSIANAHGRVLAKTLNGRIEAHGLRHEADLSVANGSITAAFDTVADKQDIALSTDNGSLELLLPADVSAEISAGTVNGSISNDFGLVATSRNWVGSKLEATLGSGAGRIRLKNINGSIQIRKQPGALVEKPARN